MKLKVGHRDIAVEPLSEERSAKEAVDGLYWSHKGLIEIRQSSSPAEQAHTAIHELLHAVWDQRAMAARVTEETAVTGLASGLAMVFRDNPEILGVLHQALANGVPIV